MADVTNLGNFGSPSKVGAVDFAQAVTSGMAVGENQRSNRAQETIQNRNIDMQMMNNLAQQKVAGRNLTAQKAELQLQLAKVQQDEDKVNREHATSLLADLSTKYNEMTPEMQKMFQTHPHYKNASKFISGFLPERVDENGNLILMNDKDVIATGIENIRRNNAQIVANGGELSDGQKKAQDMLNQVPEKEVQIILDQASKDDSWDDPNQRGTIINNYTTQYIKAKKEYSEGMKNGASTNSNDPLGVFTK